MKIYTLTTVDTNVGFECQNVENFFSHSAAIIGFNKIENDLLNKGYKLDCHGQNYSVLTNGGNRVYLDLFVNEISTKELSVMLLTDQIISEFNADVFGYDLLFKFVNEYNEEFLLKNCVFGDTHDFLQEYIIGECLYQNAAEQLGGNPNMTDVIFEFFNENPLFLMESSRYNGNKNVKDNWIVGMCELCRGNDEFLTEVRCLIDRDRTNKVFFDIENAKKDFCKDHRELSSMLDDNEYLQLSEQICGEPHLINNCTPCRELVEKLYIEFYKRAYKIAKERGFDYLLSGGIIHVFEVREDYPINYLSDVRTIQLVIVGEAFEAAEEIDYLETH